MEERHPTGILDTSTFIQLKRVTDESALPHEPLITAVTLAELSIGPLVAASDDERAIRQAHLQEAEADFDPVPFDALIAATALAHQIPVFTCNARDFEGIDGLQVIAVPVDDH